MASSAALPIGKSELTAIATLMRATGFNPAQPIVVWQDHGYLVDGHTRLAAAQQAGLTSIAIYEQAFDGWDEALAYAIARQRDRRNLSRTELNSYVAHVVRASDRLKQRGGDHKSGVSKASQDAFDSGKSAAVLGERIGVSQATVERTRAVLASDEEAVKAQLLAGAIAPSAAYGQVKRAEAPRADSAGAGGAG